MATWRDVGRIASGLAGARPGTAHEGSPTYDIGRHPFARLRWDDDGREILQFWTTEPDTEQILAERRDTFCRIDTFKVKVSVWAWLDRLDEQELTEILTDSWAARRGVRLRGEPVTGIGARQAIVEDASGNPFELSEPASERT